jgi:hypothetical protein
MHVRVMIQLYIHRPDAFCTALQPILINEWVSKNEQECTQVFEAEGQRFNMQLLGKAPARNNTLGDVADFLDKHCESRPYNLWSDRCHEAQEALRDHMGIGPNSRPGYVPYERPGIRRTLTHTISVGSEDTPNFTHHYATNTNHVPYARNTNHAWYAINTDRCKSNLISWSTACRTRCI